LNPVLAKLSILNRKEEKVAGVNFVEASSKNGISKKMSHSYERARRKAARWGQKPTKVFSYKFRIQRVDLSFGIAIAVAIAIGIRLAWLFGKWTANW